MKKYRVIVLGSGNTSSYCVKAIARREDMELIGVFTTEHAAQDIGLDAGMLRYCEQEPLGITVTGDLDALLALKPDCAVMGLNGQGGVDGIMAAGLPYAVKCLKAGVNVSSATLVPALWPETCLYTDAIAQLKAACEEGNSTLYVTGNHPGFLCDLLPVAFLTSANRIESIRAFEIMNYSVAPNEFEMKEGRGFGMPMDYVANAEGGDFRQKVWGPCVDYMAHALGYKCEDYVSTYEKALTDHDIQVAYGTIPANTVGAVRHSITGIINGKPVITVGAVNRMSEDCAPDWERGSAPGVYVIEIKGEPSMRFEFVYDMSIARGYGVEAAATVNAVPAVVEAKVGIVSSMDLPVMAPYRTIN